MWLAVIPQLSQRLQQSLTSTCSALWSTCKLSFCFSHCYQNKSSLYKENVPQYFIYLFIYFDVFLKIPIDTFYVRR